MLKHPTPSPLAGKTVRVKPGVKHHLPGFPGGKVAVVDWFDRETGLPWLIAVNHQAAVDYGRHCGENCLPTNNEVVLGTFRGREVVVHLSELDLRKVG